MKHVKHSAVLAKQRQNINQLHYRDAAHWVSGSMRTDCVNDYASQWRADAWLLERESFLRKTQ